MTSRFRDYFHIPDWHDPTQWDPRPKLSHGTAGFGYRMPVRQPTNYELELFFCVCIISNFDRALEISGAFCYQSLTEHY